MDIFVNNKIKRRYWCQSRGIHLAKRKKRLTEIITYEHPRVRVDIHYDKLISTIEAKEIAKELIIKGK